MQKRPSTLESVECTKEVPVASDEEADTHESNESNGHPGPEDVWHGIAGDVGDTAQVCTLGTTVHKPPTGVEITAIRAAQDLFMSSAFKLQVSLIAHHVLCRLTVTFPLD